MTSVMKIMLLFLLDIVVPQSDHICFRELLE